MAKICSTTITIAYLFIVAVVAAPPPPWAGAPAPSDESSPGADCFSYLADAGDCLSFVENGSRLRKPDRECCPELANLTATHPLCLCQLLFNSSQFDLSIDTNKALKLPSLCNIPTPPLSSCEGEEQGSPGNEGSGSPTIALHHFIIGSLLLCISISLI